MGTGALTAVITKTVKLPTYGAFPVVSEGTLTTGLALGSIMILGSYLGKRIVDRLPERVFPLVIEAVLVVTGLQFLVFG